MAALYREFRDVTPTNIRVIEKSDETVALERDGHRVWIWDDGRVLHVNGEIYCYNIGFNVPEAVSHALRHLDSPGSLMRPA